MSKIFVIDTNKQPLNPIHPAQARQLLRNKKAAVFRRFPFTLILKESTPDSSISPLRLKIDPGAKFTGIALVNDSTGEVVFSGKKVGTYIGRVAVRSSGSFNVSTKNGLVQGISHKYCTHIHQKDGYSYVY
jgi:hypothetical protein